MKVIKGVLEEELANSLAMKKDYEKELAKLPKGSLIKKNVKGHEYYYLVVREKSKVRFIYKGKKVGDKEIKKYKQAKEYRAKYRKLLSEIKKQIKFLRGALRGKKSV
jgi:parvulin-like peptidyl-prolyl isomerase